MNTAYVEHINITVRDLERSTRFLLAALPLWRVRGQGTMDWFGKSIRWRHVGDDRFYVALQDGGQGDVTDWRSHCLGPKHVGLVVDSVDEAVARLAVAGYPLDHWGGANDVRRSAYVVDPDSVQYEFVEYRSEEPRLRNDYGAGVAPRADAGTAMLSR